MTDAFPAGMKAQTSGISSLRENESVMYHVMFSSLNKHGCTISNETLILKNSFSAMQHVPLNMEGKRRDE